MISVKGGQTIQWTTKKVIVVVLASVLLVSLVAGGVYAALVATGHFSTHGRIVAIGIQVFGTSAQTTELTTHEWGDLIAGGSSTLDVWIKNNGTIPVTLGLGSGNWAPLIAQQYITLSWNYAPGTILAAGQSTHLVITLSVSPYITQVSDYSVDVILTGTQA